MNEYVKNSATTAAALQREKLLHNRVVIYIKDPLPDNVDVDYVISFLEKNVPSQMFYFIDSIFIGQFKQLKKNDINASYEDGAIYATNEQSDADDMIDDIVHELAHSLEKSLGDVIYADNLIENELLGKRKRLYQILNAEGYEASLKSFLNIEYDKNFDKYLYKVVGYDKLTMLTMGLFISPYGATSIREYFANGFEHYFLESKEYVQKISPSLFSKIEEIIDYVQ